VLAANADAIAAVEGLRPEPDIGRIERLLVLLWESGATPVVLLTKADLAADGESVRQEVADAAPGVAVHLVSAMTGLGMDAVAPLVAAGRTLALVGRSGAGKSTLTNALAGQPVMATREIRGDGKGRHTTAHRELVQLPRGGMIIDTPGLRGVGLWDAGDSVDRVFTDIEELAAACRFADCAHDGEPGCAVSAALESGDLSERRWSSYRKLQREAAWIAARHDARLRAERARSWRRIHLELRRSGRARPRPQRAPGRGARASRCGRELLLRRAGHRPPPTRPRPGRRCSPGRTIPARSRRRPPGAAASRSRVRWRARRFRPAHAAIPSAVGWRSPGRGTA